jgi:tetratricopeptide (TPR) repeat protein
LPEAHTHLCSVLKARGGLKAVIAHYQQVLRDAPEFAPAHANLGIALAEAGQTEEAVERFWKALRIDPALGAVHYNLGLVLYSRGQFADQLAVGRFRDARDATRRCLDLLPPAIPGARVSSGSCSAVKTCSPWRRACRRFSGARPVRSTRPNASGAPKCVT